MILLMIFCSIIGSLGAHNDLKLLLKEQANDPTNAIINYNLGVAQYRSSMYQDAAHNFVRSYDNQEKNNLLKQQAIFNAGKSHEQYGRHLLPDKWEEPNVSVEQEVLTKAIKAHEEALVCYAKNNDEKTAKNKALAEETLAKLRKKLEQQKQRDEEKKQQDEQNKNNDQKNEQNHQPKDNQQQQQGQNNQDQQSGKESANGENNQQGQPSPQQDKQKSDKTQEVDKNAQDSKQDKKKNNGKDQTEESGNPAENGEQNKPHKQADSSSEKNKQTDGDKHTQSPEKKDMKADQTATSEGTSSTDKKQDTMQGRRMQAMLANLDADESKKQKALLQHRLHKNQSIPQQGQKPW